MIKKLIASAALIAAGSALAGAAVSIDGDTVTVTSSVTGSFSVDKYTSNIYGFVFTLDSGTYTNSAGYTLDSLSICVNGNTDYSEYYLVLYSYTGSDSTAYGYTGLTLVGYSAVESSSSSWVVSNADDASYYYTKYCLGTSTSFADSEGNTSVLTAGTNYILLLASDVSSLATTIDTLATSDSSPVNNGFANIGAGIVVVDNDDDGVTVDGGLVEDASSLVIWGTAGSTSYTPLIEATLTAVTSEVPEPSAFGLLAGVAALAFAASRRRRSRKAA